MVELAFLPERLVVERRLFGLPVRHRVWVRREIRRVCQVRDGGRPYDSFPSWGLWIDGAGAGALLTQGTRGRSAWLGRLVARWAGVIYEEDVEEDRGPWAAGARGHK